MLRLLVVGSSRLIEEMLEQEAASAMVVGRVSSVGDIDSLDAVDVVVVANAAVTRELLEGLADQQPIPALVVITRDRRIVGDVAASGASGWAVLGPDTAARDLAAAVAAAARGFSVQRAAGDRYPPAVEDEAPADADRLTAREREVLQLVSRGLTNKAIALRLGISDQTVKFHLSSIFSKLGASSRTEAVRRGVRAGLIDF